MLMLDVYISHARGGRCVRGCHRARSYHRSRCGWHRSCCGRYWSRCVCRRNAFSSQSDFLTNSTKLPARQPATAVPVEKLLVAVDIPSRPRFVASISIDDLRTLISSANNTLSSLVPSPFSCRKYSCVCFLFPLPQLYRADKAPIYLI